MDLPKLIFEEKFEEAKEIISNSYSELNKINYKNNTPLLAAIDTDNVDFIRFLLEHRADPNYLIEGVDLPLNYAIETSVEAEDYLDDVEEISVVIIQLLLDYGADIMKADNFGKTPFELAKNYHIPAQKLFEERLKNK